MSWLADALDNTVTLTSSNNFPLAVPMPLRNPSVTIPADFATNEATPLLFARTTTSATSKSRKKICRCFSLQWHGSIDELWWQRLEKNVWWQRLEK
jgi:hypothetical protein